MQIMIHRGDSQHFTPDWTAKQTNEFSRCMRIFFPCSSRSFTVPLVLTVLFHLQISTSRPVLHKLPGFLSGGSSLWLCKLARFLAPDCECRILGKRNCPDDVDRPAGIVVPRAYHFTHQSFIASRIHVRASSPRGPCRHWGQLTPPLHLAHATPSTQEHPLPASIRQPGVKWVHFTLHF